MWNVTKVDGQCGFDPCRGILVCLAGRLNIPTQATCLSYLDTSIDLGEVSVTNH